MAKRKNFRELNFTLTNDDQIEFSKYYMRNSGSGKRSLWIQKLIVPVMTVAFAVFMYMGGLDMKLLVGGGGILLILSVVMWKKADDIVLNQQIRNIEGPGGLRSRDYRMDFKDDELILEYNGDARSIEYSSIRKVETTENGLYIWMDKRTAFPIPKRAFLREGDMDKLFDFLENATK